MMVPVDRPVLHPDTVRRCSRRVTFDAAHGRIRWMFPLHRRRQSQVGSSDRSSFVFLVEMPSNGIPYGVLDRSWIPA